MAADRYCTRLSRKADREIEHELVPMYTRIQVVGDGYLLVPLTYRGEHVDPRDDVPILATRVVHEVDRVSDVVGPER